MSVSVGSTATAGSDDDTAPSIPAEFYDGLALDDPTLDAVIALVDAAQATFSESRLPTAEDVLAAVFEVLRLVPALQGSVRRKDDTPSLAHALADHLAVATPAAVAEATAHSRDRSTDPARWAPTVSSLEMLRAIPVMLRAVRNWARTPPLPPLTAECAGVPNDCARTVSKAQCFGILSAGFFCLWKRPTGGGFGCCGFPSINFDEMHLADAPTRGRTSVEVAKLRMFLDYFVEMARRVYNEDPALHAKDNSVVFVRARGPRVLQVPRSDKNAVVKVNPDFASKKLSRCVMHPLRHSIDDQRTMLRADFANMMIGGASLSFGCVQEEIMFSICPEMNVARFFAPLMDAGEAILIFRAEQYSCVREGTYAFSLQYGGRVDAKDAARTSAVAAIDAEDYRGTSSAAQYRPECIAREVQKASAGFAFAANLVPAGVNVPHDVATGNWGCGEFRGDSELKILEQWVACSAAGRPMHYFPFSDANLANRWPQVHAALQPRPDAPESTENATVGELLEILLRAPRLGKDASVFDTILASRPKAASKKQP